MKTFTQTLRGAQLVLCTQDTWHILGPVRGNIDRMTTPGLPAVTCPVIDLSTLDEELVEQVSSMVSAHLTLSGLCDVDGILTELCKIRRPDGRAAEGGSLRWQG